MTAPPTAKAEIPCTARTVLHIVKVATLLTGLMEPLIAKVAIQPMALMAQPTDKVVTQPTVPMARHAGKLATQHTAIEKEESTMFLLDESEVQDFWSTIAVAGYAKDDFELTEIGEKSHASGIYALRGNAVVRRRSTSVTREYPAGHLNTWVADFDIELRGGAYGPA